MFTAREVAANRCHVVPPLAVRVLGFSAADYELLHDTRIQRMQSALSACLAAVGTPQIVASEWSDERLLSAARDLERRLEDERARVFRVDRVASGGSLAPDIESAPAPSSASAPMIV